MNEYKEYDQPYAYLLDGFRFGSLWEKRVLLEANSPTYITVRVILLPMRPTLYGARRQVWVSNCPVCLQNRRCSDDWWGPCHEKEEEGYYVNEPNGQYVLVGTEWLKNNLNPAELASYITEKCWK